MSDDPLNVDKAVLSNAAEGIQAVIGELGQMGIDQTGELGRGFSLLKLSGLQMGPDDVKSAWDKFCDKWEWGVRTLVRDGNTIAKLLNLNAGRFWMEDQYNEHTLKQLLYSAIGNPRGNASQAADTMGYTDILSASWHYNTSGETVPEADAALHQSGQNLTHLATQAPLLLMPPGTGVVLNQITESK